MKNSLRTILVSPTAYKGTLTPNEAALVMCQELRRCWGNRAKIVAHPLADGGDGTLEVLLHAFRGHLRTSHVCGPMGKKVKAKWGLIYRGVKNEKCAVIEMAEASGIKYVKGKKKPLQATSFGTGELIREALNQGCRTILLGIGGTASSDGGAGALAALGLRYFDSRGALLSLDIKSLSRLHRVDWENLDVRLHETNIQVLCDVTNPLLGPRGSATTFSPQKGATANEVKLIEKFLTTWSTHSKWKTAQMPGAGAAGALAFGLSGFLGAQLIQGTRYIMKETQWLRSARKADLIITGEGKLDQTSFGGKVIGEVCRQAKKTPVVVICGQSTTLKHQSRGLEKIIEMGDSGLSKPKESLRQAIRSSLDMSIFLK